MDSEREREIRQTYEAYDGPWPEGPVLYLLPRPKFWDTRYRGKTEIPEKAPAPFEYRKRYQMSDDRNWVVIVCEGIMVDRWAIMHLTTPLGRCS